LAPADRGLNDHRTKVRDALTCLLTETVTNDKHKEILRRVLGSDTAFDKPILSFDKPNMAPLVKYGVQNVVWENAACKHSMARSVLKPINSADQEQLLEFLGIPLYIILVLLYSF
jgi:hypothetical protein